MTGAAETIGRKIGQLASATGLTVRTLHYYGEIGLVVASHRSPAGHRLYSDDDVERLYRVALLRRLGLPLAQIGQALDDPAWDLRAAMAAHLSHVEDRLQRSAHLRSHLAQLLAMPDWDSPAFTTDLLSILEETTMLETTIQRRISILVYADVEAAHRYLVEVFGLGPGLLTRDDGGRTVHGELQAGDGVVWLHPESPEFALSSPRTAGRVTATVAVIVEDVDAHFVHARDHGAEIVYEPVDQPYGYREYSARDGEGHLWSFMKPLD